MPFFTRVCFFRENVDFFVALCYDINCIQLFMGYKKMLPRQHNVNYVVSVRRRFFIRAGTRYRISRMVSI